MRPPRRRLFPLVAAVCLTGLVLTACSATDEPSDASATLVATTTHMGSLASQLAECAGGDVTVLMGPADDPHQFEPSSAQMVDMIAADLVVANGLGLEAAMQRSLDNAVTDGAEVFEVAPQLDPMLLNEEPGHDDEAHDHDHGEYDSHVWLDVSRMADGAELLGDHIADVVDDEQYVTCGQQVAEELRTVDAEVEAILQDVESARLVTDHAAFGYFADRYNLEITGVVIPGGSTDGEPSSRDLAQLSKMLDAQGADALITSVANPNRMIRALAAEAQHDIPIVEFYESSLGEPGSGADTYQDAMRYNAKALADALN